MPSTTAKWFFRWLQFHKALNPHKGWPEYESVDDTAKLYTGWIAAFDRLGLTPAAAGKITRLIQAQPPEWPEHHLARIVALAPEVTREIRIKAEEAQRQEDRANLTALRLRREELRHLWEQMPKSERAHIQAEVERDHPELVPFRKWIEILCVEELARRHAPPKTKKSRPAELQPSM